ncbi:hypothetical protein FLJC2902T_14590 [Flavobacterium limnosediminis JC2902]|uniref:Uncharacterized protein n=1 Tax=Flavobacterium limnosediminis JC2902 TaxID=1341181 RepID=V6SRP7_9FLAO|nr:hypothetical protein FLJC2902T_14590 [Flavobacterium limnosediminis JC2902]
MALAFVGMRAYLKNKTTTFTVAVLFGLFVGTVTNPRYRAKLDFKRNEMHN